MALANVITIQCELSFVDDQFAYWFSLIISYLINARIYE